ncbi:MAG TPA: hypothetical protein VE034_07525 [Burkholderiales bacterium]|nr:hypothetical protein [Burkholderiales bacterium]
MIKRNVLTLAATAVFLATSAAFAGPSLQSNELTEMFQYGDSLYVLDKETGGAIRVAAVWDGFVSGVEAKQASTVYQDGDYVFVRDAKTGATVNAGAVWDGAIASQRAALPRLALKR